MKKNPIAGWKVDKQYCVVAGWAVKVIWSLPGHPGKEPGGAEKWLLEAGGGEWNLLDWLIRPFPNSQEGNGLPVAVTKRPMANRPTCQHRNLPGSTRRIPVFTVVLFIWKQGDRKNIKSKNGFRFEWPVKTKTSWSQKWFKLLNQLKYQIPMESDSNPGTWHIKCNRYGSSSQILHMRKRVRRTSVSPYDFRF